MVLSFFRRGESPMAHVTARIVTMLGDARHSFDVATSAVLGGGNTESAAKDIHSTDERINRTEHEIRRDLIVHISVQGPEEIAVVLGYSLLVKKVERIGDQAKNILDLALEGVSLAGAEDLAEYADAQRAISELFGDVAALIVQPDLAKAEEIRRTAGELRVGHERRIRELVHSDQPGSWAVPRAVLHRYLKRIVANLEGVALTVTDPDRELQF
jgi:uncharacterized protein with PhoU and TrkA domain